MTSRPILFSAPMIRAMLRVQDPKLMTRRTRGLDKLPADAKLLGDCNGVWQFYSESADEHFFVRCPFGERGDRLWVKETHAQFAVGNRKRNAPLCVAYRATCNEDGSFDYVNNDDEVMRIKVTKWTPAIFMPRWASRITLELTGVRVERVQDISEEDARAEGVELLTDIHPDQQLGGSDDRFGDRPYRCAFAVLWDSINFERAPWKANPWTWVLDFRRVDQNQSQAKEVATNG